MILDESVFLALAAAAGFAAMHAYESHLRATGQPVSHEKMKVRAFTSIYFMNELGML